MPLCLQLFRRAPFYHCTFAQVLEKRELKTWKRAMRKVSSLKLCGKRISQYCDTNKDKRISIAEWTGCLGVAKDESEATIIRHSARGHRPNLHQRRGPNPLKTWLKGD